MKGSKTKVGTRQGAPKWRLRVYVGRDAKGKQIFETKTYVGSARDADRELATMIELAHPGGSNGSTDSRKRTFAAALELWRKKDAPSKSPSTVRGYESVLALHVLDHPIAKTPVGKIHPKTIARLLDELRDTGLSASSVNNVQTVISSVLTRAVREGWLVSNPARAIRRVAIEWRPPTAPEHEDLPRLLEAIDDEDDRALVLLAIATGARRGELVALRWNDLDLRRGRVHIARAISVAASGAELVEKDTKTHADRTNALPAYAVRALKARRTRAIAWARACEVELDDDGFVFSDSPTGSIPWRPELVSHRWARIRTRAELPKIRFHDLRHFSVSDALAGGADPVTVMRRHGHRSLETTTLYAHGRAKADDELATRNEDRLGKLLDN